MKKTLKIVAVAASLVILASACGDDGGGSVASADDPLVQAIVDDVMADGDGVTSERAEAECFVGGVVGSLGKDRLAELGVTESNVPGLDEIAWTEQEANTLVDRLFGCMDLTDNFIEQMDLGDIDESQRDCVSGVFSEDVLKEFFVSSFAGTEPGAEIFALFGELTECGVDLLGG